MMTSRSQFSGALLAALLLHGGLILWQAGPEPELPRDARPPLVLSLQMTVAEETVASAPAAAPPPPAPAIPPPEPVPEPKPRPSPKPKPKPVESAPPEVSEMVEATPSPEPIPVPPAESAPSEAPVVAESAAPDAEAAIRYDQLLVAWLEKHKRYPRRAQRLRLEGEGLLRIRIDRSGSIRELELARRTGNRILDKAALEMARRADPFPAMPEWDPRPELEFVVPVVFALR